MGYLVTHKSHRNFLYAITGVKMSWEKEKNKVNFQNRWRISIWTQKANLQKSSIQPKYKTKTHSLSRLGFMKLLASLLTLAQGTVWYMCLNICFQFLNNITRISIYFFTHTYFQKIQTTLLKQHYQTALSFLMDLN